MTNILLTLSLITLLSAGAQAKPGISAALSLKDSSIKWTGTKVTGAHNGSVKLKSGTVIVSGKHVTGGEFEVDLNTIANEDMKGGMADKLVGHLKSDDFFAVDKYPTAKFVITKVAPLKKEVNGANHTVTGKLTIRDKTEKISFPATIKVSADAATAKASVKVDRTKFDLKYGSGKFFKGLGDKMIHDEFTVDLDLKASLAEGKK
jgi:polyisoprenoid-binding protein YceI